MKKNFKILLGIIISIIIILLLLNFNNTYSKFLTNLKGNSISNVATPVFVMENDSQTSLNDTKTTVEYKFTVKNYNASGRSEIDLKYYIEISPKLNESLKLTLYKNDQKIPLTNQKTDYMILKHNTNTIDTYKLIVNYDREATDTTTDIKENIIINAYAIQN